LKFGVCIPSHSGLAWELLCQRWRGGIFVEAYNTFTLNIPIAFPLPIFMKTLVTSLRFISPLPTDPGSSTRWYQRLSRVRRKSIHTIERADSISRLLNDASSSTWWYQRLSHVDEAPVPVRKYISSYAFSPTQVLLRGGISHSRTSKDCRCHRESALHVSHSHQSECSHVVVPSTFAHRKSTVAIERAHFTLRLKNSTSVSSIPLLTAEREIYIFDMISIVKLDVLSQAPERNQVESPAEIRFWEVTGIFLETCGRFDALMFKFHMVLLCVKQISFEVTLRSRNSRFARTMTVVASAHRAPTHQSLEHQTIPPTEIPREVLMVMPSIPGIGVLGDMRRCSRRFSGIKR
jgi:hypothetical protein